MRSFPHAPPIDSLVEINSLARVTVSSPRSMFAKNVHDQAAARSETSTVLNDVEESMDATDIASRDGFPASDAPSRTPLTRTGTPARPRSGDL